MVCRRVENPSNRVGPYRPPRTARRLDNLDMGLRGRIDRIDYPIEGFKIYAVLDYKIATGGENA